MLAAACREAREESGLKSLAVLDDDIFDCDVHPIPGRGDEPLHHHHDVRFLLEADRNEPLVVSEESHALAWVPLDKIEAHEADASVKRMVEKSLLHPHAIRRARLD